MPDLAERRGLSQVYQPAEDSRLLAEAVGEGVDPDERVLDVGTGSGFVATVAAEAGARVVGVDVNPLACREAREAGVPVVRGNLTDPFGRDCFDLVAFNPPYLPADPDAERDDWMERALTGGETGREVVETFLADAGRVLAPDGRILLLVSSLTGLEDVRAFAARQGFDAAEVSAEKFPFERLVVLRLVPADPPGV